MPWNAAYYPASMKNLPTPVRLKAIEIANALLESGHPEGTGDPYRHRGREALGGG